MPSIVAIVALRFDTSSTSFRPTGEPAIEVRVAQDNENPEANLWIGARSIAHAFPRLRNLTAAADFLGLDLSGSEPNGNEQGRFAFAVLPREAFDATAPLRALRAGADVRAAYMEQERKAAAAADKHAAVLAYKAALDAAAAAGIEPEALDGLLVELEEAAAAEQLAAEEAAAEPDEPTFDEEIPS